MTRSASRTPRRRRREAPPSDTRDYIALALKYERDVVAGRIPACKWVRLACQRNDRDRKRQKTKAFPYYFDEAAAIRVCRAKEQFSHIKGPKAKPLRGPNGELVWQRILLEPWQIWYWTNVFGWKRVSDGMRRIRIAFLSVPRKNAKSTDAATTSLYMVSADGEGGAECYTLATKKDQAKIVWSLARAMAKRAPEFREFFGVSVGAHAISVPATESTLLPLSAEADGLDGLNTHLAVLDELHAHKKRDLYDVIETSTGARDQPLVLCITTAGVNMGGICYELLTYLHKLLEGVFPDETFFGIDYTIDEEDLDHWDTEAVFKKANPNYGVSVMPDDLRRLAQKAQQSPSAINNFLTKRLNVWVKADSPGLSIDAWRRCADPSLTLEQFAGAPCYPALDLAEVQDIAAKVLLFPRDDGRFAVFGRYYLPEVTVEKSPIAQYSGWERDGWITATDGTVTDYLLIENDVVADVDRFGVLEVCFDRALAARMMQNLQRRLGEKPPVVVVPQNWETMSPAWDAFEALVLGGNIVHNGDPVLTWMISNVALKRNERGERYPVKAGGAESHNKIDGVIALLIALARAMAPTPEDDSKSIYETRGMQSIGGSAAAAEGTA